MILIALLACEPKEEEQGPTGIGTDIFCDIYEDADQEEVYEDVGLSGSGILEVTLIVDSANPRDFSLVGNATYTYENPLVGGGETPGQSDQTGTFSKTLGAGNWNFRITGPTDCTNDIEIVIEDGVRLKKCIPLYCD
jgi:hypothetical protein